MKAINKFPVILAAAIAAAIPNSAATHPAESGNLFYALANAGVQVFQESGSSPRNHLDRRVSSGCEANSNYVAWFSPLGVHHLGMIAICKKDSDIPKESMLLHEVGHVLQWCDSGKPNDSESVRPLGVLGGVITYPYYAWAAHVYSKLPVNRVLMEAEAEWMANNQSIESMTALVKLYCGVDR